MNFRKQIANVFSKLNLFVLPPRIGRISYLAGQSATHLSNMALFLIMWLIVNYILYPDSLKEFFEATAFNSITHTHMLNEILFKNPIIILLYIVCVVFFITSMMILRAKRLHDLNMRSLWLLLYIILPAGMILDLLLTFRRGNKDTNKYGVAPPPPSTREYILLTAGVIAAILFYIN